MGLNYGTICINMELKVDYCTQQSNPQWKQSMAENKLNIQYIVSYWARSKARQINFPVIVLQLYG